MDQQYNCSYSINWNGYFFNLRMTKYKYLKFFFKLASFLPAACFIGVSFAGCDRVTAVALMTLGATFMAGKYCGFLSNHIDIASNYAGTLMGLTNTVASVPGFIVPFFVGELTHGNVR